MSYAVLSCDLDTVDRHLQGYGFEDLPPCDLIYRTAVPRLLELLDELHVPAVLFTIARDADAQRALLHRAVAAGHEVASHSLTHPQPFSTLDDAMLREQLEASRQRLSDASGSDVIGFRAPAWDVDERVLRLVRDAGYRYDASVFPTPVLIASRLAAYRRSTGKLSIFAMDVLGHAFAPIRPHVLGNGTGDLVEFPIAVTPWLRLPVYHTFAYFVPAPLFRRNLRALLRSDLPVLYEFHAVDLLDLGLDQVDPRMARHPGMRESLDSKRVRLRDILRIIAAERPVRTYRDTLEAGLS
ncbi:MAG TPA: polysaccharide deacetylase family protein [Candidatus Binatia bacterium]|nr:polysaccharide deacetylase family protein [Candidatus Binatia bacterium]